jgi:hypothetical protein
LPNDPVGWVPVALIHHLDDDGFLSFDAKWVDRIEKVDAKLIGEGADQGQDLIEVRLHLESLRAVFERLRQFSVGNVSVRNENDGLQSGGARIRGHGCRRVAGGDAGDARHAQAHGLRGAAGHAVVLERSGGIESLMLEGEEIESAILGGFLRGKERGVSFAQRDYRLVVIEERNHLAIAPHAALIERGVAGAAAAPQRLQHLGGHTIAGVRRFEQRAALRTAINRGGDGEARAAGL